MQVNPTAFQDAYNASADRRARNRLMQQQEQQQGIDNERQNRLMQMQEQQMQVQQNRLSSADQAAQAQGQAQAAERQRETLTKQLAPFAQRALQSGRPQALVGAALGDPAMHSIFRDAGYDPDKIDVNAPEFMDSLHSIAAMGAQDAPRPFEQSDDYAKLNLQHRNAVALERLRQSGDAATAARRQAVGAVNASVKPIPVGALRLQQDAREKLSIANSIDGSLSSMLAKMESGEIELGPVNNRVNAARNFLGVSNGNSKEYATMRSSLEKLRNDSLRLNSGVQTEGDAQRAWSELVGNLNDNEVVKAQVARIKELNARAALLHQDNIAAVDENYGRNQESGSVAAPASAPLSSGQPVQIGGFTVRRVK
jgi:hypothetical protein